MPTSQQISHGIAHSQELSRIHIENLAAGRPPGRGITANEKTSSADIRAGFEDALLMQMGIGPVRPHPLAEGFNEQPLSGYARVLGEQVFAARRDTTERPRGAVVTAGLNTGDFKNALASTAKRLTVARYQNYGEHLAIVSDEQVPNFHTQTFPGADLDMGMPLIGENGEMMLNRVVDVAGQTAKISTYGFRLMVGRELVINDQVGLLARMFAAVGAAAAMREGMMVSTVLESTANLADGAPMFGASNTVASALSATTLDDAVKLLRLQPTAAGNLANNRLGFVVVAAGLELAAKKLLADAALDGIVRVVCLPWLPTGRWYAMASPKESPVIARLILKGAETPIIVGPSLPKPGQVVDGVVLTAAADLGVVALGRIGIVKGGV